MENNNNNYNIKNILLCGVGGQGTILASKVLSTALVDAGYDVKMSEVHGMAQRGGSVTTQVRFGKSVASPIIGDGMADILVAFEAMEAMRYLGQLKPKGKVIVNDYKIPSSSILAGAETYPENAIDVVKANAETFVINANQTAKELGNAKVMNIVLLGALIKLMKLENLDWDAATKKCVKPGFVELNLKAIKAGIKAV